VKKTEKKTEKKAEKKTEINNTRISGYRGKKGGWQG
jgi:hypothetical protein